jgi:hypothetical protein
MVVTAALVVAGGASCLSLVNNNVRSPRRAMRLCSDLIPDVARVTACMKV